MEHISQVIPKAVAMSVQPMRADPRNTRVWEKFRAFETLGDPQLENMRDEAVKFTDDMDNGRSPRWLSLLGTSGAGKTMLAKIIYGVFRDHFHMEIDWKATKASQNAECPHGKFIRYRGGFINWGNAINNRMLKGDYDFLDDLRAYSFFALDDIASEYERHRELSASKLYNVLEARSRKWTVITANLSLDQIGTVLDARIASRMIRDNGTVVDVDVPDFNLRKQAA